MASTDDGGPSPPVATQPPRSRRRLGQVLSGSRELVRIAYRDPEHVSERLTLYVTDRRADESREWAESAREARPDTPVAVLAEELRMQSARVARIDGAVCGTPFFIALVPGYLMYLLQEMRMTLRTAALYGHDPGGPETAAEMLALRGVHPDVDTAQAALATVRERQIPDRPTARRSLRTWMHSVYVLLVFGGFMSPSSAKPAKQGWLERVKAVFSLLLGVGIWITTWVLPVTFMIMMAWGCETHARGLGRRTLVFYDGEAASVSAALALAARRRDRGHDKRAALRAIALFLSVAIPLAFVAYANHVRKTTGINWVVALGGLVALSLVISTIVMSSRR